MRRKDEPYREVDKKSKRRSSSAGEEHYVNEEYHSPRPPFVTEVWESTKSTASTLGNFLWTHRKKILLASVFIVATALIFFFPPSFLLPFTAILGKSVLMKSAIWAKALMVIGGTIAATVGSAILMKVGQGIYRLFKGNNNIEDYLPRPRDERKSRWTRFKEYVKDHPVLFIALGIGAAAALALSLTLFVFSGGTTSILLPALFLMIKKAIVAYLPLTVGLTAAITCAAAITTATGLVVGLTDAEIQLDNAEQENKELKAGLNTVVRTHGFPEPADSVHQRMYGTTKITHDTTPSSRTQRSSYRPRFPYSSSTTPLEVDVQELTGFDSLGSGPAVVRRQS